MAILDNRTLLSGFETGDTVTQPDDLSGAAAGTADTEIFRQGTRSWGYYTTSSRAGLLYDHGSAQNLAGNTIYMWVNCGIAGLLDTLANGGMAARFCGATVTDWFEVNIAGANSYPAAVAGGWVMFVVDVDKAKTASNRTGGTAPATSAIRYVGVSTLTNGTMPRMADNTWLDAMWRLPANTPGVLVEGRNGGSDWTMADVLSTAVAGTWGTHALIAGGAISVNTPMRFGRNDAVQHGFADTNINLLWQDWNVATEFYGLEVIGGSGVQSFQLGTKAGTGDDATGALGGIIRAAGTGQRFFFTANGANVDACNLYGVTMQHTGAVNIASAQVSAISCAFSDCSSIAATGAGDFLRCQVVSANTADGVALLTTNDIGDIVFCSFQFSDGHGIRITSGGPSSQTSKGNRAQGYGAIASNDAFIFQDAGALRTITLTDGAVEGEHTYRNGTSASTVIVAGSVVLEVTCVDNETLAPLQNVWVLLHCSGTAQPLPSNVAVSITRSGATATVTHTAHGLATNDVVRLTGATQYQYNGLHAITVTGANTYTYAITGTPTSPATGSPLSSLVLLNGLTDATGKISLTRSYPGNQQVSGRASKGTSPPVYVSAILTGTVSSVNGLPLGVNLVRDGA